jgi:hypothetical protein
VPPFELVCGRGLRLRRRLVAKHERPLAVGTEGSRRAGFGA